MFPIRSSFFDDFPVVPGRRLEPFSRLTDAMFSGNDAGMDLYETDEGLVLKMAVPGLTAADIKVDVEGRHLTVSGDLKGDDSEDADERRYWLRSLPRGAFTRNIRLPRGLDTDAIAANVTAGLLTISIPRTAEAKARRVEISDA